MFVAGLASMKTPLQLPHDATCTDPRHPDFELPEAIPARHQVIHPSGWDRGGFRGRPLHGTAFVRDDPYATYLYVRLAAHYQVTGMGVVTADGGLECWPSVREYGCPSSKRAPPCPPRNHIVGLDGSRSVGPGNLCKFLRLTNICSVSRHGEAVTSLLFRWGERRHSSLPVLQPVTVGHPLPA